MSADETLVNAINKIRIYYEIYNSFKPLVLHFVICKKKFTKLSFPPNTSIRETPRFKIFLIYTKFIRNYTTKI